MKQLKNYILEGLFDDNKTDSISNRFALEKAIANKDIQEYGGGYYGPVFDYDVNDNTISIGKCHNWHDYIIFNKDFDLSNAKSLNISSYGLCFYQDKPMTRKWLPENIVLNSTEYSDSKTIIRTDIIGPFNYETKYGYLTIGGKEYKVNEIRDISFSGLRELNFCGFPKIIKNVTYNCYNDGGTIYFRNLTYNEPQINTIFENFNFELKLENDEILKIKWWRDLEHVLMFPKQYEKYYKTINDNLFIETDDLLKLIGYDIKTDCKTIIFCNRDKYETLPQLSFDKIENNKWKLSTVLRVRR